MSEQTKSSNALPKPDQVVHLKEEPFWTDYPGRGPGAKRQEWMCPHGVGHGNHPHGCDGCCDREDYPGREKSSEEPEETFGTCPACCNGTVYREWVDQRRVVCGNCLSNWLFEDYPGRTQEKTYGIGDWFSVAPDGRKYVLCQAGAYKILMSDIGIRFRTCDSSPVYKIPSVDLNQKLTLRSLKVEFGCPLIPLPFKPGIFPGEKTDEAQRQ